MKKLLVISLVMGFLYAEDKADSNPITKLITNNFFITTPIYLFFYQTLFLRHKYKFHRSIFYPLAKT
jgi:hypothetical protein